MPRRNHRTSRRKASSAMRAETPRSVSTDQMANDLVRRGLATPMILGRRHDYTRPQPKENS